MNMSSEDPNPNERQPRQPTVGRLAVPVWILIVALLLGYQGCIHVDQRGGSFAFRSDLFAPYRTARELDNVQPSTGGAADLIRKGRVVYGNVCSGCHQGSGMGAAGQFPPLVGSEWVLDEGPNRIIRIVLHGLQGPITVAGKPYNGAMVGFGPVLSDDDIAAVLTYIKNSKEWGQETGEMVTPEQVKAVREATAGRSNPWTGPEILAVPLN
jgi:mono/diheme cytochrome c family protein